MSQTNNSAFNNRWIVYNTQNNALTGWHSFMDNYILDFTDVKNLKIKTLGESEVTIIPYSFNSENGNIYDDRRELLYSVLKVDNTKLSLKMGERSTITANFVRIEDKSSKLPLDEIAKLLKNDKWIKDSNSIQFTNEPYKVLNQIETNFKVFIEKDEKSNKEFKGAWLLDSYNGIVLLELYSERFNLKAIYQINHISNDFLKAISTNDKGKSLLLEFKR
ncbi:hypothetical protein [Flavobacterium sp. T12S277]|uniref:hypothetical protein n=1 Tax=Flavobacterium sp. T12S277 TaxID=3402752 RepID=UPI003AED3372